MIARRILGRTGLEIGEVGFGAAEIGYEKASEDDVREILAIALEAGVNLIDTAECYGASEEVIGRTLDGRREECVILSKCGHASGLATPDWSPETIRGTIERSLQLLRTDRIDILLLHSCDEGMLRSGEVVDAIVQAKRKGQARFVGYSGDGPAARYACEIDEFDCLETSINIADQANIDTVLPEAARRNLGVLAKRSIANAAWRLGSTAPSEYSRPYFERLQKLQYEFLAGDAHEAIATALAFTLSTPGVQCAVLGTKNPDRMRSNVELARDWRRFAARREIIRRRWTTVSADDWVGLT